MVRLSGMYKRINDERAAFESQAERDARGVLERINELHRKREAVNMLHHARLDEHMTDLSEFERDLDDELRGNEPAAGSGTGEQPATAGAEPGKLASNAWTHGNAYAGTVPDGETT